MKKKVEIIITDGHRFDPSVNKGCEYTNVEYSGNKYQGASPCVDEGEVLSAIKNAKETIILEQDIPIVIDKRIPKDLNMTSF